MFEGPVTGNIPEVLDNGEVTDGTHVTAGQLALALTPYAQVTDLAATTRPPSSPWTTESPQSWPQSWTLVDDRVTAELASKLENGAETAAALVTRTVRSGRRGPEAVQLQHHGGHERLHRLGQQRHAGHGGRQLRPQDGGGPALPGHSGEDHAAGGGHQGGQRSPGGRHRRGAGLQAREQRRLHLGAAGLQGGRQRPDRLRPAVGRGHFLGGGL